MASIGSQKSMKVKKIVTTIVAVFAICFMLGISSEAATTTKATTNEGNNSVSTHKKKFSKKDLRYMTSIIYCEARGESYAGQKAVGIVVMNRKRSKQFPNSVKKVIYQSGQFSPVRNGHLKRALAIYDKQNKKNKFNKEMKSCRRAAIEALEGSTTIIVKGKQKEMKKYLFFSQRVSGAKFKLGGHQFK